MTSIHIINWVILIPLIFLGIIVLVKNKHKKTNIIFSLFIFSILIWTLTNYFADISKTKESALFWSKLAIIGPALIPSVFIHFTWLFTRKKQINKILLYIFYLISLLIIIFSPTSYNIKSVEIQSWGIEIESGILYYFLFIFIIILFPWSIKNLISFYFNSIGSEKLQSFYMIMGFGIAAIFGTLTNLVFPLIGNARYTAFGPFAGLIFCFFVSIAIIKHRLMGIKLVAKKVFIYSLISLFSYLFFYLIAFIERYLWGSIHNIKSYIFGLFFALIFAFILLPLIQKIQITGDHFFFKGMNPKKRIKKILIKLNNAIELKDIFRVLVYEFRKVLDVSKSDVSIVVFEFKNKKNKLKIAKKASLNPIDFCKNSLILDTLCKTKKNLVEEEMDREEKSELIDAMKAINAKIILPLSLRNKLIGLIILGPKRSKNAFSAEDFEFLEIIKAQSTSTIENAMLYREVKNFNRTLKKRVNEQTKELRKQNKHLEKLLKIRGEFLNIASHQLRTPVTVIKGMSDMLLKGAVPKKKREEFMQGINSKAQKLSRIIHDILSASEMDTEEFDIKLEPKNITEMIKEVIEDKKEAASEKKLKLIPKLPKKDLYAMANDRYLPQAFENLINNALRYTEKGSITVSLTENKDKLIVRVIDTGIGIPKEEIPKLFDKFIRAPNAVNHYTDGSGLGLFIVKKIINAHNGAEVLIEKSEIDKGTTIKIVLPKVKKSDIKN